MTRKIHILRNVSSKIRKQSLFLGWILFFVVMIFHLVNISRLGTYWDHQIDDGFAQINLDWIRFGVDPEDKTFQALTPYGFIITYMMWLPLKIYFFASPQLDFSIGLLQTPNLLVYRNLFVFLVFLVGLFALAVWIQFIRNIPIHVTIGILLLTFPTITGYGMMNAKDVPVFSGVACALALSFTSRSNKSHFEKFINFTFINLSILFVLGVRPGAAYLILAIFSLQFLQSRRKLSFVKILLSGIPSVFICYVFSATARQYGILWLWETIQSSSRFSGWQGTMLLWGQPYETPISRFYQFGVLSSQLPLFAFIGIIVALTLFTRRVNIKFLAKARILDAVKTICVNPVFLPPFLLIGILTFTVSFAPMLYDDSRQTIFVWAFIIPSVYVSLNYTFEKLKTRSLLILIALLSILPAIDTIKLAPYSYVYRNEMANFIAPNGFETDYWGLSGKESANWITANNPEMLKVRNNPNVVFQPFIPQQLINTSDPLPKKFLYQQIRRPYGVPEIFTECELVHTVARNQLVGGQKIMSWIRKCDKT